ncbi:hypothetical protein [Croceicoccus estronivorus]|uniref:hypothetical protein n=1 Tax=Croceicoccus estronivorus TaxID=1172626 RepID=UPI000ADE1E36|nr:hypothetical protein [Croceicoccus estronivorus]
MKKTDYSILTFMAAALFGASNAIAQPSLSNSDTSAAATSRQQDAAASTETGKPQPGQQHRKKMKKLDAAEAEPLELMDETDPCPTLPCP